MKIPAKMADFAIIFEPAEFDTDTVLRIVLDVVAADVLVVPFSLSVSMVMVVVAFVCVPMAEMLVWLLLVLVSAVPTLVELEMLFVMGGVDDVVVVQTPHNTGQLNRTTSVYLTLSHKSGETETQ
jgi:hypothetical protein